MAVTVNPRADILLRCRGAGSCPRYCAQRQYTKLPSELSYLLCTVMFRPPLGSGASADNSLRSAAESLKGTLVSGGKRLEIRHFCFAACGSSIRQEVFAGPKSLDAPEPAGASDQRWGASSIA